MCRSSPLAGGANNHSPLRLCLKGMVSKGEKPDPDALLGADPRMVLRVKRP
ncbi:hypothetical protein SAMN02745206_02170 [Desulfacinum infernum DSM 9756]|uniref:Uncharacterized protein n=1 Tax=Desulfacinum infernum DSM 9756 TaxID=1121391 RepID=A0A1M5CEA6_9BACT|nr:hypothetical protein SAMN02745206_02170 [Desulfacinum infernum DSM 9756]